MFQAVNYRATNILHNIVSMQLIWPGSITCGGFPFDVSDQK